MMRVKLFFALLFAPMFAFSAQQPQLYGFQYHKEPINPICLALINSNIEVSPFIQQIDISGCQNTRGKMKMRFDNTGHVLIYNNNKNLKDGGYAYKVIGKVPSGLFVIHVFNHHKNGKVFDDLMLVRLFEQNEYTYKQSGTPHLRNYFALKVVGYVYGGYKCSGAIKSAALDGYQLSVTTYMDHQEAHVCKLHRSYVIDLNQIKN